MRSAVCHSLAVLLCTLALVMALPGRAAPPPSSAPAPELRIVLNGRSPGRIFQGIGALSAGASSRLLIDYPEPERSHILDYLFEPDYGASLQHLKVEIGSDTDSTDGSEPSYMRSRGKPDFNRGYEWWLMEQARKRNPRIVLDSLPWGAPGWIGNGHFYSPDMAQYVAGFLSGTKAHHGLDIAYTGIWNEVQFNPRYVLELHRTLKAHGLNTKIVCCDMWPGEGLGQWSILPAMRADPALAKAVAIVGVHYPWANGKTTVTAAAKQSGKPLWASEDQPNSGGGPVVSRDWNEGGRVLAQRYNLNYLEGRLTATEIWSPITSYYGILPAPHSGLMIANTPWSGHYKVQSTIWVTAHTTQFAQPGWQYLDRSSGYLAQGGSYVSLKSTDGKNWSVVLETIDAKQTQHVDFRIVGGLSMGAVHIWETNASKTFDRVADVMPQNGRFSYTFDPESLYSLTTTTGQGKGTAEPPAVHPFPFPYRGNFDSTPLGRSPKYLSDQNGAFEVHPCQSRAGRCLQQMIVVKPIPWGGLTPNPWTLVGDENWTDYTVTADVLVSETGPVAIMGRIDSANAFREEDAKYPSGYVFVLYPDGKWKLISKTYNRPITVLASGKFKDLPGKGAGFSTSEWHHVALEFHASQIVAILDDEKVASVVDRSHAHGMIGLGTGWNSAQFDNLSVIPLNVIKSQSAIGK